MVCAQTTPGISGRKIGQELCGQVMSRRGQHCKFQSSLHVADSCTIGESYRRASGSGNHPLWLNPAERDFDESGETTVERIFSHEGQGLEVYVFGYAPSGSRRAVSITSALRIDKLSAIWTCILE